MHVKIMNVLCRFRTAASSVCRSGVLMEQSEVFRNVCSFSKARSYSPCQPEHFTTKLALCQHWRHRAPQRFYSEDFESRNTKKTGMFEEESHEVDDGDSNNSSLNQRYLQTFGLDVLVSLLRQENAVDLCVIKVPEQIKYAEYFIVASGVSPRHLRAMALYAIKVYKFLRKDGDPHVKIEGKDAEDWLCIDFGKMVVHFMLPETREVYELEKLWTLRAYDEQLKSIPDEMLPEDFMFDVEATK